MARLARGLLFASQLQNLTEVLQAQDPVFEHATATGALTAPAAESTEDQPRESFFEDLEGTFADYTMMRDAIDVGYIISKGCIGFRVRGDGC